MTTASTFHSCDACCAEVSGYSKKDLLTEGWQFHDANNGNVFVMCSECIAKYAGRWKAAA